MLPLPKLIVRCFDLAHLARHDEYRPFADVGHAVSDAFEVVRHP